MASRWFVESEWQFYALRFIIGAMEAGFAPGVGIVSPVMVGRIKVLTGSTTRAVYVIAVTTLVAAALLLWALPQRLRTLDKPAS